MKKDLIILLALLTQIFAISHGNNEIVLEFSDPTLTNGESILCSTLPENTTIIYELKNKDLLTDEYEISSLYLKKKYSGNIYDTTCKINKDGMECIPTMDNQTTYARLESHLDEDEVLVNTTDLVIILKANALTQEKDIIAFSSKYVKVKSIEGPEDDIVDFGKDENYSLTITYESKFEPYFYLFNESDQQIIYDFYALSTDNITYIINIDPKNFSISSSETEKKYTIKAYTPCNNKIVIKTLTIKNTGVPYVSFTQIDVNDRTSSDDICLKLTDVLNLNISSVNGHLLTELGNTFTNIILKSTSSSIPDVTTLCKVDGDYINCDTTSKLENGTYQLVFDTKDVPSTMRILPFYETDLLHLNSDYLESKQAGDWEGIIIGYGWDRIGDLTIAYKDKIDRDIYLTFTNGVKILCTNYTGNRVICEFDESILPEGDYKGGVMSACGIYEVQYEAYTYKSINDEVCNVRLKDPVFPDSKTQCIKYSKGYQFDVNFINLEDTIAVFPNLTLTDAILYRRGTEEKVRLECKVDVDKSVFHCTTTSDSLPGETGEWGFECETIYEDLHHIYGTSSTKSILLTNKQITKPKESEFEIFNNYANTKKPKFTIEFNEDIVDLPTVEVNGNQLNCTANKNNLTCSYNSTIIPPDDPKVNKTYTGYIYNVCGLKDGTIKFNVMNYKKKKSNKVGAIVGVVIGILVVVIILIIIIVKCRSKGTTSDLTEQVMKME